MADSTDSAAPAWTGAVQPQHQGAPEASGQFMSMLDQFDANVRAPLHARLGIPAESLLRQRAE